MAARGPAIRGAIIHTRSSWPTEATLYCDRTSVVQQAMERVFSTPETISGARRCRTTLHGASSIWLHRALSIRRESALWVVLTEVTRLSPVWRLRLTFTRQGLRL